MIAWPRCCPSAWNQLERRVGEDRVVPPGGEQLVLPGTGLVVQVPDPADDQPRGDGLAFGRREGCVPGLGDLSVGDPAIQPVVPDGARVLDGGPGVFADGGDGGADAAVRGGTGPPSDIDHTAAVGVSGDETELCLQ